MSEELSGVRVDLDRPRVLKFTLGAMEDLEDERGISVLSGVSPESLRIGDVISLLFHGLKHEDPDLTREDVRSWGVDMLASSHGKIKRALGVSLPEPKEGASGG